MKLKNQVLSIEQVQELQELGFDVRKHASLYFVEEKYFVKENFIVLPEQIDITRVPEDVKITPTLNIGDMIDVLPEIIHKKYTLEISKYYVDYCADHISINGEVEEKLIDALFQMLKWCIKEKHI